MARERPVILLDTNALLWWTLEPHMLSKKAADLCALIPQEGGIVSSITFWEIAVKVRKRKLNLGCEVREYHRRVTAMNLLLIEPVDTEIWLSSEALLWKHGDPVDRVIVATAQKHKSRLVTRDAEIRRYYRKAVW